MVLTTTLCPVSSIANYVGGAAKKIAKVDVVRIWSNVKWNIPIVFLSCSFRWMTATIRKVFRATCWWCYWNAVLIRDAFSNVSCPGRFSRHQQPPSTPRMCTFASRVVKRTFLLRDSLCRIPIVSMSLLEAKIMIKLHVTVPNGSQ